jgi:MFS family permease
LRKTRYGLSGVTKYSQGMIGSLQYPHYRFYYLATLGQNAGMATGQVTGPLLMYRLTDSTVLLGTTSIMVSVPLVVMSLLGGVIADRISKKQIIFACLIGFAVVQLGVAIGLDTGLLSREHSGSWIILLISSFLQGGLMGMLMPALQAVIPEIIGTELLMNASTLNILGMNMLNLIVPVLIGLVIDRIGFQFAYYTASGLYAAGAVSILFIPRTGRTARSGGKMLSDIKDGLIYMRRTPTVMLILLFTTAIVVLAMPYQQYLPLFTDNILKVGATGMGLLMSFGASGALAGSLIFAFLRITRRGVWLLCGGLLAGLSLLVFAFSSLWTLSLVVMVFFGLSQTFRNTIGNALLMTCADAGFMGRVMSLLNMQWGVMAFTTFFAGLLAGVFSIQWVIGGMAMLLIVVTLLFMLFCPGIRKLR